MRRRCGSSAQIRRGFLSLEAVLGTPAGQIDQQASDFRARGSSATILDAGGGGVDIGVAGAPIFAAFPGIAGKMREIANLGLWWPKSNAPGTAIDRMGTRGHATVLRALGADIEPRNGQIRKLSLSTRGAQNALSRALAGRVGPDSHRN